VADTESVNPELDALTGEDEAGEEPEVVEAAEPETPEPESTGEEAAGATPAPPPDPVPAHVPVAALQDERGKRQAAERELEQLRAEQAEHEAAAAAPDPTNDPAGAFEHLQATVAQQLTGMHIKQSRMMVMGQNPDFEAREQVFMGLAKDNPQLVDEMLAADNPAQFAYDLAVKHDEVLAMKDVDGYKERLRAEVEAEVRAKLEAEQGVATKKQAALAAATGVPSLATATEASSGSEMPSDDDLASVVLGHS